MGRVRELTILQELFAQVEAGQGQVVGIVGEPGIGKSRLLAEFRRRLRGRRLTYLAGGCRSYGQSTPYLPVRTLLRTRWGIAATDAPADMVVKVRRRLTEVGMAPEEWAPYLLWLLEVATDPDLLATVSPQEMRARTTEALVQLALHGALQMPLVLEVENLHWIDPSSEEVLTALAERLAGAAILLLTSARPGYRPPWIDRSYTSQIALARLTPAESRLVVQSATQATPLPEPLIRTIVATAGGNPFFLEELARTVVEQEAQATPLRIPNTVQAVLAARIDRLPPAAKRLLRTAAVIGREVPCDLLQTVTAWPVDALSTHLRHLQAAEFLYETALAPAPVYTFKHALTQEVAYQSLLETTRQDVHRRIAQALEERFPQTMETQPELLAHHYSQSGHIPKAVDYLHRAGQQAVERSAYTEAVSHLTTALDLLASLSETYERSQQELAVQLTLGMAFKATKGWGAPEVERLYTRARALCEQVGEPPQLFRVLWGLWSASNARGQYQTMRALGEQLLSLAQRLHDTALLLEAHHAMWTSLFSSGELAAARVYQAQGLRLYDPQRHRTHAALYSGHDPGVCCHYRTAPTLWLLGYPEQAVASSQAALALAQQLAHPLSLSIALYFAAILHHLRREAPLTQAHAEAAMTIATDQGFSHSRAQALPLRGWALAVGGHGEESLRQIHEGLDACRAMGAIRDRPYHLTLLAEAATLGGQTAAGLEVLAEALATVATSAVHWWEAELHRLQGEVLLHADGGVRHAALTAEECFQQALAIARRQQAKSLELRAAMSLSRLWQQQDKRAAAHQLLAEVYGWFTEGFDTADLQEAKTLLEALA